MSARITRFLSPPVFEDEEKTRVAGLVNGILLVIAVGAVLFPVLSVIADLRESRWLVNLLSPLMLLVTVDLKLLLHQGRVRLAGTLLSLTVWTSFTIPMYVFDGIRDAALAGYFLAIVITSLMLSGRTLFLFALLASLSIVAAYGAEIGGILTTSFEIPPSPADLITVLITLNGTALLAGLTVRRMALGEKTLREERDNAQRYLDIAGTIIVALDANQKVTLVNKRGCEVLGFGRDEIIGHKWFDTFVPARVRTGIEAVFVELTAGRIVAAEYVESPILTRSGEERLIVWHHTILKDDEGNVIGTLSSGEDITERVQAEEALRESERRLTNAQRLAQVGSWDWDVQTDEVEWTEEVYRIFGLDPEEFHPQIDSIKNRFYTDDQKLFEEVMTEAIANRGQYTFEALILLPDGSSRSLISTSEGIFDDGENLTRITGTVQDITERKKAESQREAALEALRESKQRLEQTLAELKATQEQIVQQERLAAVGQLAAGIAHDFNNLLTSMTGFAELVQMDPRVPEGVQPELSRIVKQGQRAGHLVQQILDFSRKSMRQPQPLKLAPFLKEAVKFLERTIPETIHIRLEIEAVESMIQADPTQLQQVLTNLAVNARDAMPEGGELKIRLSSLTLARGEESPGPDISPGEWVVLSVSDTGTGIPAEILPRIFEPFFTTRTPEGSGLGLAQAYGIVKQHGGYIDVESHVGEPTLGSPGGTTFTIHLPALEKREEAPRERGRKSLTVRARRCCWWRMSPWCSR